MRPNSDPPPPPAEVTHVSDHASVWREQWQRQTLPDLNQFLQKLGPLDAPDLAAVLLVDQEEHWNRGERIRAEEYFDRFPLVQSSTVHGLDLVYNEFLLREGAGQNPQLEDFAQRFPQFADDLRRQLEVHQATRREWPEVPGYEILEELGRGGMGVVYKARHLALKRLVALKMILTGEYAGSAELARLRTEAEAVARLQHPGVVQIHEIGQHRGLPYLALEFVPGPSLAKLLNGVPCAAREGAALVQKLARAMACAHERGVIHRDLKPANILIADCKLQNADLPRPLDASDRSAICNPISAILDLESAYPKITDFGLAKKLDDTQPQTRTGAILGTASYMAPEQAGGSPKDMGPAVDVYALGAILYDVLTGRPPFQGTTLLDTLEQVKSKEPVSPRQLQPRVPRDLETISLKCLQKEPGRRYGSAEALADDLGRFLRAEPIRARPVPLREKAWKWCRRRPAVAGLLGAVFLLLLGFGVTVVGYSLHLQATLEDLRIEKKRADDNTENAKKSLAVARKTFTQFFQTVGQNKLLDLSGVKPLLRESLEGVFKYYQEFADQHQIDPQLQAEVARALLIIVDLRLSFGEEELALGAADQSRHILEKLVTPETEDADLLQLLGRTYGYIGHVLRKKAGGAAKALPWFEKTKTIFAKLVKENPDQLEHRHYLAKTLDNLGQLSTQFPKEKALLYLKEGLSHRQQLLQLKPGDPKHQKDLAMSWCSLGWHVWDEDKLDQAVACYQEAKILLEELVKKNKDVVSYRDTLQLVYSNLGLLYQDLKQNAQSLKFLQLAETVQEETVKKNPHDVPSLQALMIVYNNLGSYFERNENPNFALDYYDKAAKLVVALIQKLKDNQNAEDDFQVVYHNKARILAKEYRHPEALEVLSTARSFLTIGQPLKELAAETCKCFGVVQKQKLAAAEKAKFQELYAQEAVLALEKAVKAGSKEMSNLETEKSFAALHGRADFQELLKKAKGN